VIPSIPPPESNKYKIPVDYYIMLGICALFVSLAFLLNTPQQIWDGLIRIHTSRSILITDYIVVGGIGAALVNSAILTFFNLLLLLLMKRDSSGKIVASLFLTLGFSLFGKNMFNSLPIMAGVWLYGRVAGKKFSDVVIFAMIGTTIAPIVSQITFMYEDFNISRFFAAYATGIFVGFLFPIVADHVKRMHNHYCLYNGGIAGGFIATMFAGLMRSIGVEIVPENFWDTEHTTHLAILAYSIALAMIIYGIVMDKPKNAYKKYTKLLKEKNPDNSDYLAKYHNTCYINIGILCIVSTTVILILGKPINGPILGGILTVAGFGASGKHLRNVIPIMMGSIIAVYLNLFDFAAPVNALAILFSTGLAPISGKYGWIWGVVTGFIHVSIAVFIGEINGGFNLYNNGFAGSFVAVLILPLIVAFRTFHQKMKPSEKREIKKKG